MPFEQWLKAIDTLATSEGCEGSYTSQTGHDAWQSFYNDGMTPEDAWSEEKDAAWSLGG